MSAPHRPGQAPWPERGGRVDPGGDTAPIRPPAREPIHFSNEPPPDADNPVLIWILRGLGLIAVAVISGLVWWYINDDAIPAAPPSTDTTQQNEGRFAFEPVESAPRRDSTCPEHAYGQVQEFLKTTPCQQLTRALYTTSLPDGRKVYTNVSVVRMASPDEAAKLRELTDKDRSGNVSDLVREGLIKVNGLKSVAGAGYHAVQHDRNVIIVESAFDPGAKKGDAKADKAALDEVCVDAIRLGDEIAGPQG